ncbi:hypothetical protein SAMN05216249_104100 [Acetitomaculum ruminis DSM 5522]|uniref:Uncharacterized protein n=1 Tax=Acetitomaculum ruminis DSM 5522 TaxID=1120918 RepID=A0A1I0WK07_9FIRM|nr:hypothetical protein [Acetitomaculum ruminis]SFA88470.1 hypothetical protein SAMN05216249_104100 [Acetitomaculum ruminis DSM 5522]
MSDAKTDYSNLVAFQKDVSTRDSIIADLIQQGYARKSLYGDQWETVDINDVVSVVAPGAKPVIAGGKIIYYSKDGTKAVVADISGYLRVQDLTHKGRKPKYLDKNGKEAYNKITDKGKMVGKTKTEFNRTTHYIIKKRK